MALRHGVNRALLWTWRREARKRAAVGEPAFVPLRVLDNSATRRISPTVSGSPGTASETDGVSVVSTGGIDIEIGDARVRISGSVDAAALRQVLRHFHRP